MQGFKNHRSNGVLLKFPNGNSISSIWGPGAYCENYNLDFEDYNKPLESYDVEVMVQCSPKLFKKLQSRYKTDNTVFGRINMTEWIWFVNKVSKEQYEGERVND